MAEYYGNTEKFTQYKNPKNAVESFNIVNNKFLYFGNRRRLVKYATAYSAELPTRKQIRPQREGNQEGNHRIKSESIKEEEPRRVVKM